MHKAGEFIALARPAFESAGLEVQTARLATIPFSHLLAERDVSEAVRLAQSLERAARLLGYEYISIGPAVADTPASYAVIPDILANAGGVIVSYFEWVQGLQNFFWDEEEVNKRLKEILTKAFHEVLGMSRKEGVDMRLAALMIGIDRVAKAMLLRGLYA